MRVFAPKEAINDHLFRPKIFHEELWKIRFTYAKSEALETIMLQLELFEFYDPDAETFDVVDNQLRINVNIHVAYVVV